MSCLPDIFKSSQSEYLRPSKIGGLYSLNLQTNLFTNYKRDDSSTKLNLSIDSRYHRKSKDSRMSNWKSHSFDKRRSQDISIGEESIERKNIANASKQSNVEDISNFNVVKKEVLQSYQITQKSLQIIVSQQTVLKEELKNLRVRMETDLSAFQTQVMEKVYKLEKQFKKERKQSIRDTRVLVQQMSFLGDQLNLACVTYNEIQTKFNSIWNQFV